MTWQAARGKAAAVPVLVSRLHVPPSPIASVPLRRRAERMLQALGTPEAELSLLVCDDAAIHQLNRRYRRKNRPTDVLAFALGEGQPLAAPRPLLGDVVISLETAARQAVQQQHSLWQEVTALLAHGLLHLVGFDHQTDAEERRMNARAATLIEAAGAKAAQKPVRAVENRRKRTEIRARSAVSVAAAGRSRSK